jgi:hypothetical protein
MLTIVPYNITKITNENALDTTMFLKAKFP